jgi:hypothetical protein
LATISARIASTAPSRPLRCPRRGPVSKAEMTRSAWRTLGLVVLRRYLLAAITVLAVRAIQLALGSG